jgi:hypothetical protein
MPIIVPYYFHLYFNHFNLTIFPLTCIDFCLTLSFCFTPINLPRTASHPLLTPDSLGRFQARGIHSHILFPYSSDPFCSVPFWPINRRRTKTCVFVFWGFRPLGGWIGPALSDLETRSESGHDTHIHLQIWTSRADFSKIEKYKKLYTPHKHITHMVKLFEFLIGSKHDGH